jgi:two-component system LytT family response regulator
VRWRLCVNWQRSPAEDDKPEKLNLHGFVRIHRSVLVNAALVEEIHPCPTGDYMLRVRAGRQFTVTRSYKTNLQLLAQLWIGMEGFAAE